MDAIQKITEKQLLKACNRGKITEWEWVSLKKLQPTWKFVFRGRK